MALLSWWLGTGAILWLVRLPANKFRRSMSLLTVLLVLSLLGLLVFMGFGFIVSGLAATESAIPPFSNLVTLPQFLLAGTFFPVENFPTWLQPVCRILPLTHLNEAMRNIAFEGDHLSDCGSQIGYLLLWGTVLYIVAIRVFRWDP